MHHTALFHYIYLCTVNKIHILFQFVLHRYRNGQLIYPKPLRTVPVYEGRREVDRLDELEELISDPDEMRMQSLMVRERVLGPAHPDTSYYIRYRGAVYADAGQFDRCIQLWMYALNMQQVKIELKEKDWYTFL